MFMKSSFRLWPQLLSEGDLSAWSKTMQFQPEDWSASWLTGCSSGRWRSHNSLTSGRDVNRSPAFQMNLSPCVSLSPCCWSCLCGQAYLHIQTSKGCCSLLLAAVCWLPSQWPQLFNYAVLNYASTELLIFLSGKPSRHIAKTFFCCFGQKKIWNSSLPQTAEVC